MLSRVVRWVSVAALAPAFLFAQDSTADTLPFHAHQWALQFSGGANMGYVGALHFTAPARAWLLNIQVLGNHEHTRQDSIFSSTMSLVEINLEIGRRFYQKIHHDIASHETIGVSGSFSHTCYQSLPMQFGPNTCGNAWGAGLFAELGGAYLPTPHFSIGGQVGAMLGYQTLSDPNGNHVYNFSASMGSGQFAATVYF